MRIARHVVERSKQLLVPIPRQVRDHLGLVGTAEVWWHVVRKGEVALTVTGRRSRGRPMEGADCTACAGYRDEIARLQQRLQAAPERSLRQFRMQEWLSRLRLELRGMPVLDTINERLRRIEDQLGSRQGPWRYRAKRGASRRTDTVAAPVLDAPAESAPPIEVEAPS